MIIDTSDFDDDEALAEDYCLAKLEEDVCFSEDNSMLVSHQVLIRTRVHAHTSPTVLNLVISRPRNLITTRFGDRTASATMTTTRLAAAAAPPMTMIRAKWWRRRWRKERRLE